MPRKKSRSELVVLPRGGALAHERVALPLSERRLSFGDRWGYAPAPEAHDYIKLQKRYPLFIGGEENGRGACREKGEISVVAGSFKKKKKNYKSEDIVYENK